MSTLPLDKSASGDLEIEVGDMSRASGPIQFSDPVGKVFSNRYRILERLGAGGMATVYLAEHTSIGRRLAIKILNPEYGVQPDVVKRFLQEARAASLIRHPHIVDITDFGFTPEGLAFFAMELLEGEDLCTLLDQDGPLPWERVGPMILQVCDALEAAHRKGIVHRDIKPENLVRIEFGGNHDFVKVLDFGLAKDLGGQFQGQIAGRTRTVSGAMFGTPGYIAPELLAGKPPDARVDIYSLGIVMYELLLGQRPFLGDSPAAVLLGHLQQKPKSLRELIPERVTPAVDALILRALEKDPDRRFQSMQEFAAAIFDTLDPESMQVSIGAVALATGAMTAPRTSRVTGSVPSAQPSRRFKLLIAGLATLAVGVLGWATIQLLSAPALPTASPALVASTPPEAPDPSPRVEVPPESSRPEVDEPLPPLEPEVLPPAPTKGRPKPGRPLTVEAAQKTIDRAIAPQARDCLVKHTGLFKGQKFRVRVDISANGSANAVAQLPNSDAARCIAGLFRKKKFPSSPAGLSFEVEFVR